MHGNLVLTQHGAVTVIPQPTAERIAATNASGDAFWLDIAAVDTGAIALLRETFGFHPLAIEDAEHFGQRPKIDAYDDFSLLVAFGLLAGGTPVEVHFFCTDRFVITVHREGVPELDAIIQRLTAHTKARPALPSPAMMLHRLLDALVDSYFPVLDAMDEQIDALEDAILSRPTEEQLGDLFRLKRRLVTVRRLATEQRDALGSALTADDAIPGMTSDTQRYFRDLYDHLMRLSQTADSYRDLLSSVLDTHLSTTSNRLNVVMKQMTIIATVFLPLTFLTGFFGQNFGWMVDRIGGAWVFWTAGVGMQLAIAAALWAMFRRKGWLGSDIDAPGDGAGAQGNAASG